MGRQLRANLPGVAFHLTARTQGHEPLFCGMESAAARMIRRVARRSAARLVAYAVMPNHLHVVLVQGARPLSDYMQPLLTRVALLARRYRKHEGHVFERRYRASACLDADYFRNAIAYVHLNPVRAGLCREPGEYSFTSHSAYCGAVADVAPGFAASIDHALRIFSHDASAARELREADYVNFLSWRLAMDGYLESGGIPGGPLAPRRPSTAGGNRCWAEDLARRDPNAPGARTETAVVAREDLRRIALLVLREAAPEMGLDALRSGERLRDVVRVRRLVIARALMVGYAPGQIARFLNVSRAAVSRVAVDHRPGARQ
jgi:REP element-mobilizing transposase RayT